MLEQLKELGITLPQVVAFLAAIPVAYLSARFGARESRRQYEETARIAKRQAATELIYPLMAFALDCNRINALPIYESHRDQLAAIASLQLPPEAERNAAKIGAEVAARVLKLRILKTTLENLTRTDFDVGCPVPSPDAQARFSSYVSLLELRARWVADLAAKHSGLAIAHTDKELEALLKAAMRYGYELDVGDEGRWPLPAATEVKS